MSILESDAGASASDVHHLATKALTRPEGSALLLDACGRTVPLEPARHEFGALVGLTCPPDIRAVASTIDGRVWLNDRWVSGRIAWAVDRLGGRRVVSRIAPGPTHGFEAIAGPLLDVALRALAIATPGADEPVVRLVDSIFLERALSRLLDRDLGATTTWTELSVEHPLADDRPATAGELLDRRLEFARTHSWERLRRATARTPASAPRIATGLDAAVAGWLDAGAFSRWVLGDLPSFARARSDVSQLVDGATARELWIALADPRG